MGGALAIAVVNPRARRVAHRGDRRVRRAPRGRRGDGLLIMALAVRSCDFLLNEMKRGVL
jgi:hypothetical protein